MCGVSLAAASQESGAHPPARGRTLAPALLVASPDIQDPNFHQSVVFLLSDDEEGSFGLILTNPSHILGAQVGKKLGIPVAGKAATTPVHQGGPVDPDRGFVLHGREDVADDAPVVPGVYVDAPERVLATLLKDGETNARLYVGYCGWAPGQLQAEVDRGDWVVMPATAHAIFDVAPDELWNSFQAEHGADAGVRGRVRARPRKI